MNRSRWCLVGVVVLLFLAGLGALAEECTITVRPGESIQATIDAAPEGAVICLAVGEWEEHLTIAKTLTVRGAGNETVIRGLGTFVPLIHVDRTSEEAVAVTVSGLTVTNGGVGVYVTGTVQAMIRDMSVLENQIGILVEESAQAILSGLTIAGSAGDGIVLAGSSEVSIEESTIVRNERFGLALFEHPCFATDEMFAGYVTGSNNVVPGPEFVDGNAQAAACPPGLVSVAAEEDGAFDRRALAAQLSLAKALFAEISILDHDQLSTMEGLYLRVIEEAPLTRQAEYAYWLLSNMYMRAFSPPRHGDAAALLEQYMDRYPGSTYLESRFAIFAREGISLVENRLLVLYQEEEDWQKLEVLYDRIIPDPTSVASHMVDHLFSYGDTMQRVARTSDAITAFQTYLRQREDIMPALRDAAQRRLVELGAEPVPEEELADSPDP